jgi:hypothetical protein
LRWRRQRKYEGAEGAAFETAARGLKNMGFRDAEVRGVLAELETRLDPSAANVETILREALRLLT